ncbi:potassium transporter [Halalkalicoccus paucihalophilus]|uniref:Potassium transporter n=1 Tax=Halalkalicoccus paucihalophilus TaxID=1008153 RepID=A0A151AJ43_9EURY|nr:TrkH family potassium uptake protein [Halalkalicoccus paucihalophilus]KYH27696.1 potassium transporter [Halalkalicoccus paucihalophilus]
MRSYVDWRASVSLVGTICKWLSVPLSFPLLIALYYGDPLAPFLGFIAVAVALGTGLGRLETNPDIGAREAFLLVTLGWVTVAIVGAVPYVIAGNGTIAHPINALFESMSGFTTTGATVLADISFETHSRSVLMWRQLTQWIGGMGIIVLGVAILSQLSVGGIQLMEAEAPGPSVQKLTPTIARTARILWGIYLTVTVGYVGLLYGLHLVGLAPNMDLYNAIAHGFTTLSTGGFSPEARSIEAFSPAVQWLVIPFMVVAGTNFALVWQASQSGLRPFRESTEFRTYLGVIAGFGGLITVLLVTGAGVDTAELLIEDGDDAVRHALFQIVSILTTTGFASLDFNFWTPSAQFLLFVGMFIGGMSGSTAGGVKIIRWIVIIKSARRELFTAVHPEAVRPVRIGGQVIDERAIRGIYAYTLLYVVLFFAGTLFVLEDAVRVGIDIRSFEAMSATAATLGNIGPGFGTAGPMATYETFPDSTKLVMVLLMWIGRLEILPVLAVFTPAFWRR